MSEKESRSPIDRFGGNRRNPLRESEPAYLATKQAWADARAHVVEMRQSLGASGLRAEQTERGLHPAMVKEEDLREQMVWYERSFDGEFDPVTDVRDCGRLLIALRLASGRSQRELAMLLNVPESQISRDERNEYHGVSVDRASLIANTLGSALEVRAIPLEPANPTPPQTDST